MKAVVNWICVMILLLAGSAQAREINEGIEYVTLSSPQPVSTGDRIEVLELFWYGCPHCYSLEPYLKEWKAGVAEDVAFVRMPAILGKGWELLAKGYYTADMLGVLDRIHDQLFDRIHKDKIRIKDEAMLRDFFVDQGVSEQDFDKTFNSFAVNVKVNRARLMTKRYAISGVPTLIVNGKFSTSASLAGGNDGIIEVVDYLVAKERKSSATTASTAR